MPSNSVRLGFFPDSRVFKFVALSLLLGAGAWAQQPGIITTVVGNGTSGYTNGPVSSATLSEPYDVVFDSSGKCTSRTRIVSES